MYIYIHIHSIYIYIYYTYIYIVYVYIINFLAPIITNNSDTKHITNLSRPPAHTALWQ